MKKKHIALILVLMMIAAACGGRVPKPSRSQKIIQKYFKKYAKKYPDSIYGKARVTKVEIDRQEEIRKNCAAIDAYLSLGDGTLKKIDVTIEKGPLGWRFLSWEDATGL